MALLLKRRGNTIKSRLTWYIQVVSWIVLLVLVSFSLLHIVSVGQYQKNTDQILMLNSFYNELDNHYQLLKRYVDFGEEGTLAELEKSGADLGKKMEQIYSLQINARFSRDIEDFFAIFRHYQEESKKTIEEGTGENEGQNAGRLAVRQAQAEKLYQMMTDQYKDLAVTLINAADEAQQDLNVRTVWYYVILLAVILVFLQASIRYASRMTNQIALPIQKLERAARQVRSGELDQFEDVMMEEPSYEEVESLAGAFNTMVHQMKDYILLMEENARTTEALHRQKMENLRMDSLLKASELKALQLQMNPHFLFNTLNMIAVTADLGDTDRTVVLLQKTAQLLRYSLDYAGKTVTLAKEIEMLGNYVFLQEQRFGSRIFFDFDLDERFHQIQVPCFILQPLIENAIIHGLGNRNQNGKIIIRTKYDEKSREGQISVLDNGAGMTAAQISQIRETLDSYQEQRRKIGLANIHMRLRLLLGDRYAMDICSSPGKGTEVRIRIFLPEK